MASKSIVETDRYVLFWGGWPSQWAKAAFDVDGVAYDCCEQFMMAEKARVSGDEATLAKILAASDPRRQKALGREVRGFDADRWSAVCRGVVYRGNLARFSQVEADRASLLATGDRVIVEASPTDRIWGVGLAPDDPRALDESQWRGTNWLGVALMQAREAIRTGRTPDDEGLARQLAAREA